MKSIRHITALALAVILASADTSLAKEPPANTAKAPAEIARDDREILADKANRAGTLDRAMWIKSRGYLSEDPMAYRLGAEQKLAELHLEIAMVRDEAGTEAPAYFRTRITALEQHLAYLKALLPKLTPKQIGNRMTGSRFAFDQSIQSLEEAIDQARRESQKLVRFALR